MFGHADDIACSIVSLPMFRHNDAWFLKRWLFGPPLKTKEAAHERLSKRLALAVFSSDSLSSVAYATEEILLVLTLAGTAMVVVFNPDQPLHHRPAGDPDHVLSANYL